MSASNKTMQLLKQRHKEEHPDCQYGDQPHYVPPSGGMIGFYMCDVPEDLVNHSRCQPPYDHEHELHWPEVTDHG